MNVFFKKDAKLLNKFPGLATLGGHNSATITDRPELTTGTKIALYGMSSIFIVKINSKSFSLAVRRIQ